ncbi:WD40-repeat-containing domain protein [Pelagophyceae sp. CCMP2097]|nr:WD40-repeat-containing domain protein [Pelagophyceae sp. CCMP2097]
MAAGMLWEAAAGSRIDGVCAQGGLVAVATSELDGDFWRGAVDFFNLGPAQGASGPCALEHRARWAAPSGAAAACWVDGASLAVATDAGDVVIVSAAGEETARLEAHDSGVSCVAASANGSLASGAADAGIKLWDLSLPNAVAELAGHAGAITALDWAPDGALLSASRDRTVRTWDVRAGAAHTHCIEAARPVVACRWAPGAEGGAILCGLDDGTVGTWDVRRPGEPIEALRSGTAAWRHAGAASAVAVFDGGVASGGDDGVLALWGAEKSQRLAAPRLIKAAHSDYIRGIAIVEIGGANVVLTGGWDGRLVGYACEF